MAQLDELAAKLEALERAVTEAATKVAPEIETALRAVGKEGKALRAGNAVAARVTADGTTVNIKGIFTKGGKRRSWSKLVGRSIKRAMQERLEK